MTRRIWYSFPDLDRAYSDRDKARYQLDVVDELDLERALDLHFIHRGIVMIMLADKKLADNDEEFVLHAILRFEDGECAIIEIFAGSLDSCKEASEKIVSIVHKTSEKVVETRVGVIPRRLFPAAEALAKSGTLAEMLERIDDGK